MQITERPKKLHSSHSSPGSPRCGNFILILLLQLIASSSTVAAEIDFAHDIAPILKTYCGECHTGDQKKGGLSLNTRDDLLAGGEGGAVVILGKGSQSDLIERLASTDESLRMPPKGARVPPEKVALLKKWIDSGIAWESGFAFQKSAYEPPLKTRRPSLPPAIEGRSHPIDRFVDAYFAQRQVARTRIASDQVFLRRVTLDLTGLLPEPARQTAFMADQNPQKRALLVEELLSDRVAYAEHWLTFWNDLLRNDYTGTGFITGGRKQISSWLHRSLIENKPYDQFVRELISPTAESEGYIQGIRWRGNVSASQQNEVQFAQSISQSFLGINMKCASCHDSFIDHWKLSEAFGLAAIYATQPLEIHRCDKPTGKIAVAAWLFPELGNIDPNAPQPERLKQLAGLMTHPENGRFTRTIVNRLWHRLMGRGIVHPVDAMHTEPWSPDLLDHLAIHLRDNHYDLKQTLALICTSEIYQAEIPARDQLSDTGSYVFRGPLARRLSAEQFMDGVWQVTGTAPAKPDAQVVRSPLKQGDVTPPVELIARWIWSRENSGDAPAGEAITVRHAFDLKTEVTQAVAAITCDNSYTLYVNGKKIQTDDSWESPELISLDSNFKTGRNEILIVGHNGGAGPNPAGLIFEARLKLRDGSQVVIGTDKHWQFTKQKPGGNGKLPPDLQDWMPAAEVANHAIWSAKINPEMALMLTEGSVTSPRMVRASLVKSDSLMRSLGRPNRDQIVSMRPSELTTLEAIDLANGSILADLIDRGATRLLHQIKGTTDGLPPGASTQALIQSVYRAALSRPPEMSELEQSQELLGDNPQPEQVADFLWSILMLPEFQVVR